MAERLELRGDQVAAGGDRRGRAAAENLRGVVERVRSEEARRNPAHLERGGDGLAGQRPVGRERRGRDHDRAQLAQLRRGAGATAGGGRERRAQARRTRKADGPRPAAHRRRASSRPGERQLEHGAGSGGVRAGREAPAVVGGDVGDDPQAVATAGRPRATVRRRHGARPAPATRAGVGTVGDDDPEAAGALAALDPDLAAAVLERVGDQVVERPRDGAGIALAATRAPPARRARTAGPASAAAGRASARPPARPATRPRPSSGRRLGPPLTCAVETGERLEREVELAAPRVADPRALRACSASACSGRRSSCRAAVEPLAAPAMRARRPATTVAQREATGQARPRPQRSTRSSSPPRGRRSAGSPRPSSSRRSGPPPGRACAAAGSRASRGCGCARAGVCIAIVPGVNTRLDALIRVSRQDGRNGESFRSPVQQRESVERWAAANGAEIVAWHEGIGRRAGP